MNAARRSCILIAMGEHNGRSNGKQIGLVKDPITIAREKEARVQKSIVTLREFLAAHTNPEVAALADGDAEFVEVAAVLCTHALALQQRCRALETKLDELTNPKSKIVAATS